MKKTDAIEFVDRQKRDLEQKKQEVSDREYAQLERSTRTRHEPFVDMRDALAQVRAKNYQPTQDEIEYQRFSSGSWVDNPKGK